MIITTRTFTRKSVDIPWHFEIFPENEEFVQRLIKDFVETRKILTRVFNPSDLTIEMIIIWADKDAMNEHFNDPRNIEYFKKREDYNKSVGISESFNVEGI